MPPSFRPKRFPMSPEDYNLDVRLRHIEDALTGLGGSAINFNTLVNAGTVQSNGTVTPSSGGGGSGGGGGITMLHGDATGPAASTVVVSAAGSFDILNGVETITFTDTGGGADLPALRPSFLKLIHHTTAVSVPGVGERLDYVVADNAGTDQQIASQIGEITAVAAGAVDGTIGWEVMHTSNLCEVARCRASTGLAATAATAFDGFIGGELWVRANFYNGASGEGTAGFGSQAVAGTKVFIKATADADRPLALKKNSATQSGHIIDLLDEGGNVVLAVDANARDLILDTSTGSKVGTATSQKLAFWNATPIVQPGNTTDLRVVLINTGLLASGGANPLDLNGGVLTASGSGNSLGSTTFTGDVTLSTHNLVTDGTTGTQIATVGGAAGQKLGVWGATPIVQPLLATGAGHTVDDVIGVLQSIGWCRQT